MKEKIKRWLRTISEIIALVIFLFWFFAGVLPKDLFENVKINEIWKWVITIIVFAPMGYLVFGAIIEHIKPIIKGFKAETSPMRKVIFICRLASLIIVFYELYYYFRGYKLGLILALLSFIIWCICSYLLKEK